MDESGHAVCAECSCALAVQINARKHRHKQQACAGMCSVACAPLYARASGRRPVRHAIRRPTRRASSPGPSTPWRHFCAPWLLAAS